MGLDDPFPYKENNSISSLPNSYISALSAVQEQSFIEAGFDNPDYYEQLFTYKHKATFVKVGFLVGIHDSFFILLGIILINLAKIGAIHPFKHEIISSFDMATMYFVNIAPFLITFFLTFKTFKKITGIISRKMAFYLISGFSLGVLTLSIVFFILGYWIGLAKCQEVYIFLSDCSKYLPFLQNMADFYWDYIKPTILSGTWIQLSEVFSISIALYIVYYAKILHLKKITNQKR